MIRACPTPTTQAKLTHNAANTVSHAHLLPRTNHCRESNSGKHRDFLQTYANKTAKGETGTTPETIAMKTRTSIIAALSTAFAFCACDDDLSGIGTGMMPEQDSLSTYYEAYPIISRTVKTGRVVARTNSCFIGCLTDPETQATTSSSFLAQFHLQEDYTLPDIEKIVKDEDGNVKADSCVLRIFHDKFYGDSLTTMKLTVTDLDLNNVMEENETYYTDIDPKQYLNPTPKVKRTLTYSVIDRNLPITSTSLESGNYRSIPVHIGKEYGTYILKNYYEHPEYFRNSYTFNHNVCPGFYVEHTGGIGSLINSDVSVLDVYFKYADTDSTTANAWMRLGATQEVIQNTRYDHDIPEEMLLTDAEHPYTYVKSPAGLHTEIDLPVKEMLAGEHRNDTINCIRLSLKRYNNSKQDHANLKQPETLLLIGKGKAEEFFNENKLPDNETCFMATYNKDYNAYTFSNIAPLVAYLRKQRDNEAGVTAQDTEETKEQKRREWEAKNPDWQTFELRPVKAYYNETTNYYGQTVRTLIGLQNDYNLTSVKLEGSPAGEVKINVIYSNFKR